MWVKRRWAVRPPRLIRDVIDQLGEAVGLTYEDNEPLDIEKKVAKRDERRWELDPASSEGYAMRVSHEGEYEEK